MTTGKDGVNEGIAKKVYTDYHAHVQQNTFQDKMAEHSIVFFIKEALDTKDKQLEAEIQTISEIASERLANELKLIQEKRELLAKIESLLKEKKP